MCIVYNLPLTIRLSPLNHLQLITNDFSASLIKYTKYVTKNPVTKSRDF